ncbi:MAG TPA: hypothetical protein VHT91_35055 [Kofleriaceae bacterium]|jgi:hypothetical protein|nr:hypothetical protein [Kofleriaceae bacterium]
MYADNAKIFKYAHLIARLAYEDEFRETFTKDPNKVLEEMGIGSVNFPPGKACKLPSKELLQQQYQDRLSTLSLSVHEPSWAVLCDGKVTAPAPGSSPRKP